VTATLLVIVAFGLGFLRLTHVYGMGMLFMLTMGLLATAFVFAARETWMALEDYHRPGRASPRPPGGS
jgi:hypothetical protein